MTIFLEQASVMREIDESTLGSQVGDIADPELIGSLCGELFGQIGLLLIMVVRPGSTDKSFSLFDKQIMLANEV